jgi:hypothetical protein
MAVSDIAPTPHFELMLLCLSYLAHADVHTQLHFGNSDGPPTQSVAVAHFPAQTADIPIIAITLLVCDCGAADAAAVD